METALFEKHGLHPVEKLAETRQIEMWKMIQPAISRSVLVHLLKPELADNPDSVSYLFSVIRAISNVNGPALADIYTIIDEPDFKAVVTEYVEGLTLEAAVAALGPLSIRQVVRTGSAIAESLAAMWNTTHIIHGGVQAAFVVLDAGSTAKLISPCFARVAAADESVPASDMFDLGNLLYFLATGVRPGGATSVVVPPPFLRILQRLTSESVMTRYASWETVMLDLRTTDSAMPDVATTPPPAAAPEARAPGASPANGRRRLTLRPATAEQSAAPASPHHSSARHVPLAVRLPAATAPGAAPAGNGHAAIAERNSLEAIRKAATEKTARDEEGGSGLGRGLMCVLLAMVLIGLFCYRIESLEPAEAADNRAVQMAPAETPRLASGVSLAPAQAAAEQPVPSESADAPAAGPEPAEPVAAAPEPTAAQPALGRLADDATPAAPVANDSPDATMNRYLAAHVGRQIPLLYKGQRHPVTLVSYDDTSVTVKTRKTLTLPRASLSKEQRGLWQ